MKASLLCLFLVSLLVANSQVKGDGPSVKLCGREFIRAVIYTCGGSRWRRHLTGSPQGLPEIRSPFYVPAGNQDSTESLEIALQRVEIQNEAFKNSEPQSVGQLWQSHENSVQEKRDLNQLLTTACCISGCNKKDLSSLC
ncbi:insulin-like peptide INSL5 [Pleurodeles waltl]|uniref:insulin-like peptide INSL5 n=1 Tax=Pleurodeles waltl TaxID=8319 RepID=UPI003709A76A